MESEAQEAHIELEFAEGVLKLVLSGPWKIGCGVPDLLVLPNPKDSEEEIKRLSFNTESLGQWDSLLMTFLVRVFNYCRIHKIEFVKGSLPDDIQNLLALSQAVPEKEEARREEQSRNIIQRAGDWGIRFYEEGSAIATFSGECSVSVLKLLSGRVSFRWRDFFRLLQEVGAHALPIVTLISFLIGLIVAFLGAVVLSRFGADLYVSYLVGYGVLRELGPLMTGIIIAGRTGAAFAAEIGSMKVSEEIDALKTLGISPIDFIVLPRMMALLFMMPLLVIYADVIGIFSGMLISNALLDIPFPIFLNGMKVAVALPDIYLGIIKGVVFGVLVAVSGCLRGIQSGNSADAVGLATTSAVVTGITLIIFFNALIDWIAAIYGV